MSSTEQSAAVGPVTLTRIPDPAEPVPVFAVPTLCLLGVGIAAWSGSSVLYLAGELTAWATIALNAIASYVLFTVAHDASHHSASSIKWLNDLLGRISTPFFAMHAAFPVWRYIHMQHHRFTNHDDGADPDRYTMRGPRWQVPLRWLTIDYAYLFFYLERMPGRPQREKLEAMLWLSIAVAVPVALIASGKVVVWLVLLFVPSRLTILFLSWAFDYLPHHGLDHTPSEDRLKATRNRVGHERLLSPTLLYQNYHLVHHLHPVIPFYRYIAVWRRNEERYLAGDPSLCTARGRPITPQEYRQLR
ncbi:MAG: fatty acid desaturase [Solirubrobacteraceae bacterium]